MLRRPQVYLELVLLVFGALVERPVVAELPDVVHFIEAFDVVGNALPLQHLLALGNGSHSVDLQIWEPGVKANSKALWVAEVILKIAQQI